ncbi:MAG: hypothetical protein IT170_17810 [Bryobacterales bacterium]|nr:hypothetical protein [Bryobacterales bacterium]
MALPLTSHKLADPTYAFVVGSEGTKMNPHEPAGSFNRTLARVPLQHGVPREGFLESRK